MRAIIIPPRIVSSVSLNLGIWGDNFMTFCINKYDYDSRRVEQRRSRCISGTWTTNKIISHPLNSLPSCHRHGACNHKIANDVRRRRRAVITCNWRVTTQKNQMHVGNRCCISSLAKTAGGVKTASSENWLFFLEWKVEREDEELTNFVFLLNPSIPCPISHRIQFI